MNVPVICAGRMDDPDMALQAIQDGTCDMVSLGRPLLADPDYVNKLRGGRVSEIRPCISCQEGCMGRIQEYSALNCAVNPQACRERATAYNPVCKSKKVLVVGGGVAGCEAARVLAIRGHSPTVMEKNDHLGGNLIPGGAPDFKEDDIALADWFTKQLELLMVPVILNKTATKEDVLNSAYDSVIIATGSTPKVFDLGDPVYPAADILTGKVECGPEAVIIGGGLVGCETALYLAQQGKKVTIVEALDRLLAVNGPLCHANSEMLEKLIPFNNIDIITSAKAAKFAGDELTLESGRKLKCDTVILAVGYESNHALYRNLEFEIPDIHLLGDARRVSNIMYAIWDAFEVANHI